VRGAIVALKEARECVELRSRLRAELRAADVVSGGTPETSGGVRRPARIAPREARYSRRALAISTTVRRLLITLNAIARAIASPGSLSTLRI